MPQPRPTCSTCGQVALVEMATHSGLVLGRCVDCLHDQVHFNTVNTLGWLATCDLIQVVGHGLVHPDVLAGRHRARYVAWCLDNNQASRPLEPT